ncbi:hypothetical protein TGAM01_v200043 [Trichoderma gamsii]|uniref:Uncharacterized protein n=1 Tax=Trichoderma gamsii TaxID=398673 RepID=A0A2P5A258_9HYPO|nr:hypothetical protein TGAM01_v200043 [Trichoderma gamsii]PON30623.1 hypothetical protein TGAM01_v200043 [Trichoderma gamsii]
MPVAQRRNDKPAVSRIAAACAKRADGNCFQHAATSNPASSISEHQPNLGEAARPRGEDSSPPTTIVSCHSANLLGSWSAMPLDPCAQSAGRVSQPADWQRSTRRSGPGATAATKLVRLGQRPTSSFKPPASGSPIFCFPEPERSHQMLV